MHIIIEILLHRSICRFQAQNVLIASFHCFQSAFQVLHVFLQQNTTVIKVLTVTDIEEADYYLVKYPDDISRTFVNSV